MAMRWLRPRFTIGRLMLTIAVATPLAVSLTGYATGSRCPLCLSDRVVPHLDGMFNCVAVEQAQRGEIHLGSIANGARTRWYCRACELVW